MNFNKMVAEALKSEECRKVILDTLESNNEDTIKKDVIKYGKNYKVVPTSIMVEDQSGVTNISYLTISKWDKVKLKQEFIEFIMNELPEVYKKIKNNIDRINVKLTRWSYKDLYDALSNGTLDCEVSKTYTIKNLPKNENGTNLPIDVLLQNYINTKYPNRNQIVYKNKKAA